MTTRASITITWNQCQDELEAQAPDIKTKRGSMAARIKELKETPATFNAYTALHGSSGRIGLRVFDLGEELGVEAVS